MAAYAASSSSDSRDTSPDTVRSTATSNDEDHAKTSTEPQKSPFLRLPVDIFKCVTDYLDRDAAWALKRSCRGMSHSKVVAELLYKHPIQLNDVRDLRLADWKYRPIGEQRWINFQESINDSNRHHVQRLAMSHWASVKDFQWIEEKLPNVISLDISAIKDFVWTPEETWTWKQLADTCPKLFARLEELEVSNWADYTAHSRIEYSYSYNDYRFKPKFRISRRRDGGSVAKIIFPVCLKLKTLAIRERYSGYHSWNEWEVHQRVCSLVNGIEEHCPSTLTKLRVHDYGPYRSLFCTDVARWGSLKNIEIGLYNWLDDRRSERELFAPVPFRIMPGNHHREEEEVFDDKTFEACERNHMEVGQHVVAGVNATFVEVLQNLRTITQKYPNVNVTPIDLHRDIVYQPFHLVNVTTHRRATLLPPNAAQPVPLPDPISSQEVQDALRWLAEKCGWRPILDWGNMMSDVFPENMELRHFLPKADVVSRIQTMVRTLRSLKIPVRLSIGDRSHSCYNSPDGCLYFGDYKGLEGEGDEKREVLGPTQARFNLSGVAELVDELTIQYPVDVPGVAGWSRSSRATEAERILMDRERIGWRRFWKRYALQFKHLKKLTATVPSEIYNDWAQSDEFRSLVSDEEWEMLEVDEQYVSELNIFGSYLPFSNLRYSTARKRPRMKFVQRVFFRKEGRQLQLNAPTLSDEESEARIILDSEISTSTDLQAHRFWPAKPPKAERSHKRKADGEVKGLSVKRARLEDIMSALTD